MEIKPLCIHNMRSIASPGPGGIRTGSQAGYTLLYSLKQKEQMLNVLLSLLFISA